MIFLKDYTVIPLSCTVGNEWVAKVMQTVYGKRGNWHAVSCLGFFYWPQSRRYGKNFSLECVGQGQKWRTERTQEDFLCLLASARALSTGPPSHEFLLCPVKNQVYLASWNGYCWFSSQGQWGVAICSFIAMMFIMVYEPFHHFSSQNVCVKKFIEYSYKFVTGCPIFYLWFPISSPEWKAAKLGDRAWHLLSF